MAIWFKNYQVEDLNLRGQNSLSEYLGIRFSVLGEDFVEGTMPVDQRTKQPVGLLHGGASVALAETLASTGANLVVDLATHVCVGLEINANHIRSAREGIVTGRARPIHIGNTTQVWETTIRQGEHLICISRMTLSVLKRKTG